MRRLVGIAAVVLGTMALGTAHADSLGMAERGGFLLGAARHCGISEARVLRVGQAVVAAVAADGDDSGDAAGATTRFAQFFVAASAVDTSRLALRCAVVSAEFAKLERHTAAVGAAPEAAPKRAGRD